jgi:hypothetical protein
MEETREGHNISEVVGPQEEEEEEEVFLNLPGKYQDMYSYRPHYLSLSTTGTIIISYIIRANDRNAS